LDLQQGCGSLHGEEKFMTSRPARILLSVLLVTSLGGCATTGRVDALEKRLDEVSRKADDAATAAANAQKTANSAASRADAAEAQAKAAAQRADDAARTAEAIFKKRVSK
jgi:Alanine-zipper, major outer membrane lipoprotein